MSETKEKIENFVEEIIKNEDLALLDILWTFSYSIQKTGKGAWLLEDTKDKYTRLNYPLRKTFLNFLFEVIKQNLEKKFNLTQFNQIKEKREALEKMLMGPPNFPSYTNYDKEAKYLENILMKKSSGILFQNVKIETQLDKKILSFILSYLKERQENRVFRENEEKNEQENKYHSEYKYFILEKDKYFLIGAKKFQELTSQFHLLCKKELKGSKPFQKKSFCNTRRKPRISSENNKYRFWELGDKLVKMGIGYWAIYQSTNVTKNVNIIFIIPNFIYENIKNKMRDLPLIENFAGKISEIKKELNNKKAEFKEVNEISEIKIEEAIVSNIEVLESGLHDIKRQFNTDIGIIDILCKDKDDNYVVIELKRGRASDKVVGQILRYIGWVSQNLTSPEKVRGIIVASKIDKKLEHAISAVKFIKIMTFNELPPIEENVKYCDACGKINKKTAKFCNDCGEKFWMQQN